MKTPYAHCDCCIKIDFKTSDSIYCILDCKLIDKFITTFQSQKKCYTKQQDNYVNKKGERTCL